MNGKPLDGRDFCVILDILEWCSLPRMPTSRCVANRNCRHVDGPEYGSFAYMAHLGCDPFRLLLFDCQAALPGDVPSFP
ncbi:Uncharacterised protein [Amycolatopsis camponoti]|uniref:Uncharacterized protein n=1 Tax=Amycolatopsis camponoti TaxID=2606593 RepID=A0A6I8M752_9PSEU|nr:Uncharacterised protein [Amycolatopsis camponoti]